MARPTKEGLDYFSFDSTFFSNRKIRKIMRACGPSSPTILICLLCSIYENKGYYIEWDEELPFDIADLVGVSEGSVKEVVKKSLDVSFFDVEKFENYKILTSSGIQERYVEGTRKRKEIVVNDEFWIDGVEKPINVPINQINSSRSTQRKVKESKGNIHPKSFQDEKKKVEDISNLIDTDPPLDGVARNWDAARKFIIKYNIVGSEANEIIRLSNYGQVSSPPDPVLPFWKLKREVEKSNGKIRMPGAFILSRMRTVELDMFK